MINLHDLLTRKIYNHESEIQRDYLAVIEHQLNMEFHNKFNTDGYTLKGDVKFLVEFKRMINIMKKEILCRCIIQALVYIATLEREEGFIPQYTFIATERYYCFFETSKIADYRSVVSEETNASNAWKNHPDLIKILMKTVDIPVLSVTENIQNEILSLFHVDEYQEDPIKITSTSIETVLRLLYEFKSREIITETISTHAFTNIFIGILIGVYKPVEGENILSTTLKDLSQVNINRKAYNDFILLTNKVTDPKMIDEIVANKSELIDQVIRRYEGEFFTPQELVDLGNYYLSNFFGAKWRDSNIVHEPTWGLGQLTRGREFKYLFCSTLNQEDVDFAKKLNYNDEALARIQYDWLTDDCDIIDLKYSRKLPTEYLSLCKRLPLIILSNFPYGAAGDDKLEGSGKDNISNKTKIHEMMQSTQKSLNKAMENLYTQCLYRCLIHKNHLKKKDFYIACYCPAHFLSGPGFKGFRDVFFREFTLESGFIIPSKVFKSLKSDWPIMFGIFSSNPSVNHNSFLLDVYDENLKPAGITTITNKNEKLRDWVPSQKGIYNSQTREIPIMASYINVGKRTRKQYIDDPQRWPIDVFSTLVCDSNNIEKSRKSVYIINCGIRSGLGRIKINKTNLHKCLAVFTARKCSVLLYNTETAKKEYSIPDETNPALSQYIGDSMVYSIFNESSHQASLKDVYSCGKTWNIENELFWLSKEFLIDLSRKFGNREVYNHAKQSKQRVLYDELSNSKYPISKESIDLLKMSEHLVEISFYNRDNLNKIKKDLSINRWDCGWKQLKELLEFCNIDLNDFNNLYKTLEKSLLQRTIDLGFI